MLAEAVQTDVLDNHHFVILFSENRAVEDFVYVFLVTFAMFNRSCFLIFTFCEKVHRLCSSRRCF